MTKKSRNHQHTRRRFSMLSLAGAVAACGPRRRPSVPSSALPPFEQIHESDADRRDGWLYSGAPHESAILRMLSDRAARNPWGNDPAPTPRSLAARDFLPLGPQRSLSLVRDGILMLSERDRLGYVDARFGEYKTVRDGIALVASTPKGPLAAAIDLKQNARILSPQGHPRDARVPTLERFQGEGRFDDLASQAWVFSRFVVVAYSGLRATHHDPDPPCGLVAFALTRRDARLGDPILKPLARLSSGWESMRAHPSATGLVLARPNSVNWCDWMFRCTARWYDHDDALHYLEAAAIAQRGRWTHVLYHGGLPSQLVSFPQPGATPRMLELPFERGPKTPQEWTKWGPPWLDFQSPTAVEAWTPLAGPDGRVALAPPGELLCYDADGNIAWQFKRNGSAPAVLLEDGLLVEHDGALFVLNWSGEFRLVWRAPATVTARPVFHQGSWYVATAEGIHRLR